MQDRRIWLIVLGLSIGPAVSNGFARFAYGLILPSMQQELAWSFTAAGWINTTNAIGYLIGALLALRYVQRLGAGRVFVLGMVLTSVALICSGLTRELWLLSLFRIFAGIGSAPVFIAGGVLVSSLFQNNSSRSALAIAIYFGGGGLGMLLTGLVIPLMLDRLGSSAWPQTWLFLGVASTISLLPAVWAVRAIRQQPDEPKDGKASRGLKVTRILPALTAYFMFGVGYFVYMTFLVAWMRIQGDGVELVIATWSVLSVMVMLSPFVWRSILAASTGGAAIALTLLFTAFGTLMPLLVDGAVGLLLSATLFGLAFFMVPGAVTNFSKKNYPRELWGTAVSLFTIVFAIGQMIGPAAAGWIADQTNSLTPGLAAAGVVLLIGAVSGVLQRRVN
ncbi:MAG: MFS family permease [Parasphingorhabdus sp.]|jgi:MFS family permease